MSLPGCWRSLATSSGASPESRTEFCHGSGSRSVRDATYLRLALRTSVKGLSVWCGQKE